MEQQLSIALTKDHGRIIQNTERQQYFAENAADVLKRLNTGNRRVVCAA